MLPIRYLNERTSREKATANIQTQVDSESFLIYFHDVTFHHHSLQFGTPYAKFLDW